MDALGGDWVAVLAGVDLAETYVELSYVDAVRQRRRRPLLDCVTARFEDTPPVRPFRWSRGERHFSGWYWSATTGQHVGFESWLERDRLVLMDSDPGVVGIASQPFWLHWHDGKRERRHAPDYFVRRADGSAVVIDVRADERIEPKDAEAFEVTQFACAQAGWGFERVGVPEAVLAANVRWLSRYRHPRCLHRTAVDRLREVFATPRPLLDGADAAGDRLAMLPALFHLLWIQELAAADLSVELMGPRTVVGLTSRGVG
ncbi:TnsA-like heteromeric transposase endonuclease subunit [Streptomyces sp. NBC_01233]|uniref:TnsA-like heteromeric transposase endonuclease subunit n=1 Tax=Streptomyces sp. NBC_01233 TaxID=2903787 RepID=UPI002E12B629|nr:TnsA-like heteromeric transposase endonuclease subunit [Streptomyces sp. NBC_01233]